MAAAAHGRPPDPLALLDVLRPIVASLYCLVGLLCRDAGRHEVRDPPSNAQPIALYEALWPDTTGSSLTISLFHGLLLGNDTATDTTVQHRYLASDGPAKWTVVRARRPCRQRAAQTPKTTLVNLDTVAPRVAQAGLCAYASVSGNTGLDRSFTEEVNLPVSSASTRPDLTNAELDTLMARWRAHGLASPRATRIRRHRTTSCPGALWGFGAAPYAGVPVSIITCTPTLETACSDDTWEINLEDTNSVDTHRGLSEPANSLLGADAAAEVTIIECKPRGLNASASPLLDTDVATEDTIIECTPGGLNASANSLTDANHEDNYHLDSLNSSPCLFVKPCNLRPLEACVHVIVDGVPTSNPEDGLLWENLFGAEMAGLHVCQNSDEDNYHLDSLNSSPCTLAEPRLLRPLGACAHVIFDGVPTSNPEDVPLWENLYEAESESLLSEAHALKLSMHEQQFARPLLGFSRGRDVLALLGVSRAHVNLIGEM
jgi:hypothetical protein